MRIDKWLWAARFFKTRAQATKACDLGRIFSNGQRAKPAREVRVGDMLGVRTAVTEFQVEGLALSEMRGPPAVARTLYRETQDSEQTRARLAEQRRAAPKPVPLRDGKLSKRDRREMNRLRGGF